MLDMDTQVYYDYRATLVVFTTVSCALFDVNATIASEMFDIFINTARENKMAKLNQRVAISKYLMKEALLKLLKEKSIGKISVSELCKEAEINRTTFYRYYETPRDILQEIALDCIKELLDQTVISPNTQDIREFATRLCVFLHEHSSIAKLFVENDAEIDLTEIFQILSKQFLGSRTVLYRGQVVDDDTLRLMNTFFSSGIYALIRQWLTEDISKAPEEIAELLYRFINMDFSFE